MKAFYNNIECENCNPEAFAVPESNAEIYCAGCETLATPGHGKCWVNKLAGCLFLAYFAFIFLLMLYYSDLINSLVEKLIALAPGMMPLASPIAVYCLLPALLSLSLGYFSAWELNRKSEAVSCKK